MTTPPPLSPAAQAVLDALPGAPHLQMVNRAYAAAVLRAVAQHECESVYTNDDGKFSAVREDRLLAIAAELDGHSNG